MSGSQVVMMGDRGRIVVQRPHGLVLMTQQQLRDRVRDELAGLDLVTELLADRRRASKQEDMS